MRVDVHAHYCGSGVRDAMMNPPSSKAMSVTPHASRLNIPIGHQKKLTQPQGAQDACRALIW